MFIGTVYYGKNIVEQRIVKETNIDKAIEQMAEYTFTKYNAKKDQIAGTYTCTVLDTNILLTL